MNNTFAIFKKKEKFCPTLLEGILHAEFFEKEPFEPRDSDIGEWRTTRNIETSLPKELWFVTKDKKYEFDFRWDSQGFLISSDFLNLLIKFQIHNIQYTKLHIVNKHKENVCSKEYYYLRFYDKLEEAIDLEKSKIDFDNRNGSIKEIWDLRLKNTIDFPNVFVLNNIGFAGILFCSEEFKEEAERLKIMGISFIPADQAGVYKP